MENGSSPASREHSRWTCPAHCVGVETVTLLLRLSKNAREGEGQADTSGFAQLPFLLLGGLPAFLLVSVSPTEQY